jgi:23S rRNA (adenine2503-C2)-methyltransferase
LTKDRSIYHIDKTDMRMDALDFRNLTLQELTAFFEAQHFNSVRTKQFFDLVREQAVTTLTALEASKGIQKICRDLPFTPLSFINVIKDSQGNEKFIFKTHDELYIETLYMPRKTEPSVCISSQVGCRWHCRFCFSGRTKLIRNLYPHEIIEQVRQISLLRKEAGPIRNVGFMGMGEPLDNLANCMQAVDFFNSHWGWQISRLNCTFSTSGCLPFDDFFRYQKLPNLALSLHSVNQEKRLYLMPAAKIPLPQLKSDLTQYCRRTRKQVTIEYCLFDGINDSEQDALELVAYLQDVPFKKINLLSYNTTEKTELKPASVERIMAFRALIKTHKISTLFRKSLGTEIGAGCGQLGSALNKPLTEN